MIPFLDLAAATNELRHELDAAYQRVLDRNWFILGSEVRAFEEEFAEFVGANHCIGVANGLDALTVTLRCLGIGQGDEVIAPANTFIATWLAVARTGATVVGCDVDAGTLNMTASDVRPHITERTKAILPVHLYGQPVDAAAFDDLENETNVPVVYDAAQAHGATFDATPIGAFGAASTWSFYPGKNLGCLGDGGAITTNDDALAEELRVRRNYGSRVKYVHQVAGTNSRLDELQAAFLRVKLRALRTWNARRAAWVEQYRSALGEPFELVELQPSAASANHLFVIRTEDRAGLQAHLADTGVGSQIHYPVPCHLQGAFAGLYEPGAFPTTERAAEQILSLPMGPHLGDGNASKVIERVLEWPDLESKGR